MSAQEFKVGDTVRGDDYARLPVGSKAVWKHCADSDGLPAEKIAVGSWREGSAPNSPIRTDAEMSLPRTLTYLPAAAEPEDKDDLYVEPEPTCASCGLTFLQHDNNDCQGDWPSRVEPEPLKTGDWVQVWAQVDRLRSDGDTVIRFFYGVKHADGTPKDYYDERVRNDAIVRPADGSVPPWLTEEHPVTVTISGTRVFSEESGAPMVRLETGPGSYALIPIANISSITEGGTS